MQDPRIQDEFTVGEFHLPEYDFEIPDYSLPETTNADAPLDLFDQIARAPVSLDNTNAVSLENRSRYNDPFLSYQPGQDTEDLYAKIDPFTWGDSFEKAGATFGNHFLSNYKNLISGLKSGSAWDNEYSQDLVQTTKKLEEMYPQYRTADERDNPLAIRNWDSTLKSIFPAVGTVGAGVVDMVVGNALLSAAAPITSGLSGVVAGTKILKDANKISKAFKGIYDTFKTATVTRKSFELGKAASDFYKTNRGLVIGGLFYANGEAALQGAMNSQDFYNKEVEKYRNTYGEAPSEKVLAEIEQKAQSVGRGTFLANLALIGGSNIIQFPNLIRGTVKESLLNDTSVKLVNNKLVKRNFLERAKQSAPGILADSFSEGFEEFGQGVIDKTFQEYFGNNKGRLESINASITESLNQEGLLDFLGGALIGGGVQAVGNVGKGLFGNSYRNDAISQFNNSTREYLKSANTLDNIKSENLEDDNLSIIAELARVSKATNTHLARTQYLEDLRDMSNDAFRDHTQLDLNEAEQKSYINKTLSEFKRGLQIYDSVHKHFDINPLVRDKKLLSRIKDIGSKYFWDEKSLELDIWNKFRNIQYVKLFKAELYQDKIDTIANQLGTNLDGNIENVVKAWKDQKILIDAVETNDTLSKLLPKLPELSGDFKKDFIEILKYEGAVPHQIQKILQYKSILQALSEDVITNKKELAEELNKILDWTENTLNEQTPDVVEENTLEDLEAQVEKESAQNIETPVQEEVTERVSEDSVIKEVTLQEDPTIESEDPTIPQEEDPTIDLNNNPDSGIFPDSDEAPEIGEAQDALNNINRNNLEELDDSFFGRPNLNLDIKLKQELKDKLNKLVQEEKAVVEDYKGGKMYTLVIDKMFRGIMRNGEQGPKGKTIGIDKDGNIKLKKKTILDFRLTSDTRTEGTKSRDTKKEDSTSLNNYLKKYKANKELLKKLERLQLIEIEC